MVEQTVLAELRYLTGEKWHIQDNDLSALADADKHQAFQLCAAIQGKDIETVKSILNANPRLRRLQIEYRVSGFGHEKWEHFTLLMLAIVHRNYAAANLLIQKGMEQDDLSIISRAPLPGQRDALHMTARDLLAKYPGSGADYQAVKATLETRSKTFNAYRDSGHHHQFASEAMGRSPAGSVGSRNSAASAAGDARPRRDFKEGPGPGSSRQSSPLSARLPFFRLDDEEEELAPSAAPPPLRPRGGSDDED